LYIIGGVRHQIPGFYLLKILGRKMLYMGKQLVSQTFFHPAGKTDQAPAPAVAKHAHQQRDRSQVQSVAHQNARAGGKKRQIVNGPFDDPGNEQLKEVHGDQAANAAENLQPLLDKIWQDQG
jgi:hypothetical protein